jgi:hypothetical protein
MAILTTRLGLRHFSPNHRKKVEERVHVDFLLKKGGWEVLNNFLVSGLEFLLWMGGRAW